MVLKSTFALLADLKQKEADMTQHWMDGFDHYGTEIAKMLEGPYADVFNLHLDTPATGARTGAMCLKMDNLSNWRRVLNTAQPDVIVGYGLYFDNLPAGSNRSKILQWATTSNVGIASVVVRPDGALQLWSSDGDGGDALLGETSGAVLVAGSWQHIEVKIHRHAVSGTVEVRIDELPVVTWSGLALGASDIGIIRMDNTNTAPDFYVDDLIARDNLGAYNNTFMGDLRVATLQPVANGVNQGWAHRTIEKLSVGLLNLVDPTDRNKALSYADDAAFELGAGDYCIEGIIRTQTNLVLLENSQIWGKWRASTNECSWRLRLTGPDSGNNLIFETSTLGTLADAVAVHTWPLVPTVKHHIHVAITREGTVSRMFLDGNQIGADQVDNRSYFDGAALLLINGEQSGATSIIADSGINGWNDGFRLTVGDARYTANFIPPTDALPNTVGGDPLYNSVELLLNFDDVANTDESVNAFVGVMRNDAELQFPDDGEAFQTIDGATPVDDDFVEAELINATETLTLTGQPLNTETVTIGATTYTFLTVFVDAANNVLIGATTQDSLDNLSAAVRLDVGAGVTYGAATVQNLEAFLTDLPGTLVLATARTPGTPGNTVVSTETLTNGSWGAATLSGGLDIPTNSEFTVSMLPPEVTGVRALAVIGRNYKTDNGSSSLRMSYVHSGGSVSAGADRPVSTKPTYYEDTHEVDPSTAGALTPSSVLNARIRLDRTV